MGFEQRQVAVGTAISIVAMVVYLSIVVTRAVTDDLPLTDVAWQGPLLWTVLAGAALFGIIYASSAIHARKEARGGAIRDARDEDIMSKGVSAGASITGLVVLAVLIMLALDVDSFWVANVLFVGTWLGSLAESATTLAGYREGVQ